MFSNIKVTTKLSVIINVTVVIGILSPFLIAVYVWHIRSGHNGNTGIEFVLDHLRHFVGNTCQIWGLTGKRVKGRVMVTQF